MLDYFHIQTVPSNIQHLLTKLLTSHKPVNLPRQIRGGIIFLPGGGHHWKHLTIFYSLRIMQIYLKQIAIFGFFGKCIWSKCPKTHIKNLVESSAGNCG